MLWDVAIIGGGPAGMMAATRAAERGRRTILLDKNREPGIKILLSGGTRCNLTHATDARGIVEAFGPNGRFLHSALAALGPQQVVDLFEAEGVPTKVEPGGKVFPASDRAADVRDALVRRLERSGCTVALGEPLVELLRDFECSPLPLGEGQGVRADEGPGFRVQGSGSAVHSPSLSSHPLAPSPHPNPLPKGEGTTAPNPLPTNLRSVPEEGTNAAFQLVTPQRTIAAAKVLLATGGQSYPACGTTGDGYRWAAALGHRIVPPHTALVPVTSHAPWVRALQGITLPDVFVRVVDSSGGEELAGRRGALLFAHFGVSGPAVMDVSHAVSGSAHPEKLVLRCDLLPEVTEQELDARLASQCIANGQRRAAALLDTWLPHRVGETLLVLAEEKGTGPICAKHPPGGHRREALVAGKLDLSPFPLRAAEFSKADRRRLAQMVKRLDVPVAGTMGFRKAEVTAGGVALEQVDSRTMQSRLVPNLYFAGELLDLDGPVGGYNFQAAFSTGWLAGESM